jgi:hypothetical protein
VVSTTPARSTVSFCPFLPSALSAFQPGNTLFF